MENILQLAQKHVLRVQRDKHRKPTTQVVPTALREPSLRQQELAKNAPQIHIQVQKQQHVLTVQLVNRQMLVQRVVRIYLAQMHMSMEIFVNQIIILTVALMVLHVTQQKSQTVQLQHVPMRVSVKQPNVILVIT